MEERKLNILIVHNYYKQPGGEGIVVENERNMLENHGHKVILYTKNNNEIDKYNIIQKALLPINYLFNINTYLDIKRIIKEQNIDIVHVHNTINIISKSVYYAAIKCKTPIVQTVHNFRFLCPNGLFYRNDNVCEDCINKGLKCAIKHKCYRNSLLETVLSVINMRQMRHCKLFSNITFICLTEFNKNKLLELNNICKKQLIKEENIYVKPNFVINRDLKHNSKSKNCFVYASRLDNNKGIKFLLNIWKNIDNEVLYVCGSGDLQEWCENFIKTNNLKNIVLKGYVSHEELIEIISSSKGLVYPTQLYEGMPMSIIEAYSVGTPVVAPNFGNAGSLVKDGITGYKYNNDNGLIDAIYKLANDSCMYEKCFDTYIKEYSEEINYIKLMNIYGDVLKK